MSGDLSLFGDDHVGPSDQTPQPARAEGEIAEWLVNSLREALTGRGLTEMAARREAIESVVGHPVESLRSLTRAEALRVLDELTPAPSSRLGPATSWTAREGDTWIDRI